MLIAATGMADYRRNLPHWLPEGRTIFLTWRLFGSLPTSSLKVRAKAANLPAGERFRAVDRALDRMVEGPFWLKDPSVASCVVKALRKGESELNQYKLLAYVVMPNHVHVLLTPKMEVSKLMDGLKGFTARAANKILNRTGKPFWQDETFDHWLRRNESFPRLISYIENNPVKAKLVARAEDWPWSSANDTANREMESKQMG
jgi:REP element-mobilizing transposase RayT